MDAEVARVKKAAAARMRRKITQNEIDIREIECAITLLKNGSRPIWSCVRDAIDRLESDEKAGNQVGHIGEPPRADKQ